MDEAIIRLKLAADAGADVCFIEGVVTTELLESAVAAIAPKPAVAADPLETQMINISIQLQFV